MTSLTQQSCDACRADAPRVTDQERQELHGQIPDWILVEEDGIEKLQRVFPFGDFAEALTFTNQVGELAEKEGHHPAILTEYGKVTVTWWTHKIGGLHRNDFISAAKTDALGFAFRSSYLVARPPYFAALTISSTAMIKTACGNRPGLC